MQIPKSKQVWLTFKLEVEDWDADQYDVVYTDQDGKECVRKVFRI